MAENANDVERHFRDLENQLQEDGFPSDSQVMKTARRLLKALKNDGFTFGTTDRSQKNDPDQDEVSTKAADTATDHSSDAPIVRAFRTRNEFDSTVITSVFSKIDGWKTKIVAHKGSHFVVATNAKRLTDNRVRQAIIEYVQELKQAQPAK